jgi:hypothetical protein
VFKDLIYWDDWKANAVFMADKDTGHGITTLMDQLPGPMDLKVQKLEQSISREKLHRKKLLEILNRYCT